MRETEVEILVPEIDFKPLMEELAGELGLPLIEWCDGKTTDHYIDTKKRTLLENGSSLRLRDKVSVGGKNEFRLTIKRPIEEHEILLIRDEVRLRLFETDWRSILDFTERFVQALGYEAVETTLLVDEYYSQVSIGTPESHLDVSLDEVAYLAPEDVNNNASERILEFEDHGVGADVVLKAYRFINERFGYEADRRGKYRRGLELLGLL